MPYYWYHIRIIFENALVMMCNVSILFKVMHASIICQLKLALDLMKTIHASLYAFFKATVRLAIH